MKSSLFKMTARSERSFKYSVERSWFLVCKPQRQHTFLLAASVIDEIRFILVENLFRNLESSILELSNKNFGYRQELRAIF